MLDAIKRYVDEINKTAISIYERGIDGKSSYTRAINNHFCLREEADIMSDIIKEFRTAIRNKLIYPCSALVETGINYYLANLTIESCDIDSRKSISVLYKEDNDVDMIWIFGLPYKTVIALEWNVHLSSGKRYFETSSAIFDTDDDFVSSMSMFFTGVFARNI